MNPSQEISKHRHRILLVDDEEDIVYVLRRGLELRGFEVDGYSSSVQALEKFKPGAYDIALLDMRMPGLTGIQLFRELQKRDPAIIPAFMSAFEIYPSEFEKVFPSIGSKVKTIVKKPVSIAHLTEEITALLQLHAKAGTTTGDHIFVVFDTPEELIEECLSFLKAGLLENNEDVIMVTDQLPAEAIRQKINREWGIDSASPELDGRITLMSFSEWHLPDERKFDASMSKARIVKMAKQARDKGGSGTRFVSDGASFVARGMVKELADWELSMKKRFSSLPLTLLCAHTKESFSQLDSQLSSEIVQNHNVVILNVEEK